MSTICVFVQVLNCIFQQPRLIPIGEEFDRLMEVAMCGLLRKYHAFDDDQGAEKMRSLEDDLMTFVERAHSKLHMVVKLNRIFLRLREKQHAAFDVDDCTHASKIVVKMMRGILNECGMYLTKDCEAGLLLSNPASIDEVDTFKSSVMNLTADDEFPELAIHPYFQQAYNLEWYMFPHYKDRWKHKDLAASYKDRYKRAGETQKKVAPKLLKCTNGLIGAFFVAIGFVAVQSIYALCLVVAFPAFDRVRQSLDGRVPELDIPHVKYATHAVSFLVFVVLMFYASAFLEESDDHASVVWRLIYFWTCSICLSTYQEGKRQGQLSFIQYVQAPTVDKCMVTIFAVAGCLHFWESAGADDESTKEILRFTRYHLMACGTLLISWHISRFLMRSKQQGEMLVIVGAMGNDVLNFSSLLALYVMVFAVALGFAKRGIAQRDNGTAIDSPMSDLLFVVLGFDGTGIGDYTHSSVTIGYTIVLSGFMLLTMIVLLNLLIAMSEFDVAANFYRS
jgi:hypothetical protein